MTTLAFLVPWGVICVKTFDYRADIWKMRKTEYSVKNALKNVPKIFHITNDKRPTDLILTVIKRKWQIFNLRCFENQLWPVVDYELASDKIIFVYLSS